MRVGRLGVGVGYWIIRQDGGAEQAREMEVVLSQQRGTRWFFAGEVSIFRLMLSTFYLVLIVNCLHRRLSWDWSLETWPDIDASYRGRSDTGTGDLKP